MQPKLKENPRDWLKFTTAVSLLLALLAFALRRRGIVSHEAMWIWLAALAGVLLVCVLRPRSCRGFYRAGMTMSFYVGQFVGRILLMALFLFVVTPVGLFLRLIGKDFLQLKRDPSAQSYWQPVKGSKNLDREF